MGYHKEKTKSVTIQMTQRELATVMAALRLWQRKAAETTPMEMEIARKGGLIAHALSNTEIDTLCVSIATGQRDVIPMPGALTGRLTSAQDIDLLNQAERYGQALDVVRSHRKEVSNVRSK